MERETRGQPFRVDTAKGPLFVWMALWRFAGRGGPNMGEPDAPDEPVWGCDWHPEEASAA